MWVFAHVCKASIREQLWSAPLLSLRGPRDGTQVARLTQQTSFPLLLVHSPELFLFFLLLLKESWLWWPEVLGCVVALWTGSCETQGKFQNTMNGSWFINNVADTRSTA